MRKVYPSDISREQYEQVRVLLENARKKTKPREADLYQVFCAVLYVLKRGCQWRMLPSAFPKWRTVCTYFGQWNAKPSESELSLLEQAVKKSGWRGPHQTWSERTNPLFDR